MESNKNLFGLKKLFDLDENPDFEDWLTSNRRKTFYDMSTFTQNTNCLIDFKEQGQIILLSVNRSMDREPIESKVFWSLICTHEERIEQMTPWEDCPVINLPLFFEKISRSIFKESLSDEFWNASVTTQEFKVYLDKEKWKKELPQGKTVIHKPKL